jgi:hypothetical protein
MIKINKGNSNLMTTQKSLNGKFDISGFALFPKGRPDFQLLHPLGLRRKKLRDR